MEIIPKTKSASVFKTESELVEVDKHEYKLVGSFLKRKGLKLFSFNPLNNDLCEVDFSYKETANAVFDENGANVSSGNMEASIDSRNIHFEALNHNTALKRVERWKNGEIKSLDNLKRPNNRFPIF